MNEAFRSDNLKWDHHEFIKRIRRRIIIEPDFSQCITGGYKILTSSVKLGGPAPSFPKYLLSFLRPKKRIATAILFDGDAGNNYFHFFSDVINSIWLLPEIKDYKDIPFIINIETCRTKYFQYFLKHTELKDLQWIVQEEGQYIEVDQLYLIRPMPYEGEYYKHLRSMPGIGEIGGKSNKRIFLNRSPRSGRFIKNMQEIEPILQKYEFEMIDTDNMELDFQMGLFHSAQYLISIHGAGNANIIFSDRSLSFLEIMPSNRLSCQYYWLSLALRIDYYDVVLGGDLPQTNVKTEMGIYLDPTKLETAIWKMLKEKP